MSYAEKHLIAGEIVQYETRLHWIVMLGHTLIAAVLALVGVSLLITPWRVVYRGEAASGPLRWAGVACVVVAAIFFGIGFVRRSATEMAVTNKRVMIKTGLLRRRTFELLLSKVESIGIDEGILGRVLGYGSVVVRGTGGTPEPFRKVGHPLEFRRQVQQQVEMSEQSRSSGPKVIT